MFVTDIDQFDIHSWKDDKGVRVKQVEYSYFSCIALEANSLKNDQPPVGSRHVFIFVTLATFNWNFLWLYYKAFIGYWDFHSFNSMHVLLAARRCLSSDKHPEWTFCQISLQFPPPRRINHPNLMHSRLSLCVLYVLFRLITDGSCSQG